MHGNKSSRDAMHPHLINRLLYMHAYTAGYRCHFASHGGFSSVPVRCHLAHPIAEHRLTRVDRNDSFPAECGMCRRDVKLGDVAYRCVKSPCTFVLHDDCHRYPQTIGDFSRHRLTLAAAVYRSRNLSCGLCHQRFDGKQGVFLYSCDQKADQCHGFHAHPRCCNLPGTIGSALHPHRQLILRPPNGPRTCLDSNCESPWRPAAWSYQCPACDDVELCLASQLGGRSMRCCCNDQCGCGVGVVGIAGQMVGVFLGALVTGCIGLKFDCVKRGALHGN